MLRRLRQAPPPEVPEGYFDSFESRLMNRIEDAELREENPELFLLPKTLPEVPSAYFEQAQRNIMDAVRAEAQQRGSHRPVRPLWQSAALRWSVAAAAVLLAAAIWIFRNPAPVNPERPSLTEKHITPAPQQAVAASHSTPATAPTVQPGARIKSPAPLPLPAISDAAISEALVFEDFSANELDELLSGAQLTESSLEGISEAELALWLEGADITALLLDADALQP